MRLLRFALFFLLPLLLAAALLAAWLVPPQLDWARYRSTIAQLASARLGLPVAIEGPVTLRLLPEPVLTAGKVSVGDQATDGMLIRVQALRLRVGLWPLLAGRIDARELVLHRPDLHIPWPASPGVISASPPLWLAPFSARLEDGSLSVGQFAVTGITGTLSSLASGALRASVAASIAGQHWTVAARLTGPDSTGASGLTLHMQGQGRAAGTIASFTGQFAPSGQLAGSVKASGPDLALLLPAPALAFQAEGRLTVADGLAEADELSLKLDRAAATGAVALRMLPHPRLDIALSATKLDLDPWAPLLFAASARQRPIPIGLDFSASAAALAGATLRHLRATFELTPEAVSVQGFAAELPGNAILALTGRIAGAGGVPVFDGTAHLQAPVLRTTLRWLLPHAASDLDALPPEVAVRGDLNGTLRWQPGQLSLTGLAGQFDGNALSGSVAWKAGNPPELAADLRLARMPLDPWLSRGAAETRLGDLVLHRLNTDLRLSVQHASLGGTAINGLALHAATLGGSVMLRRLQGSVQDARFTLSGSADRQSGLHDGRLLIVTDDALQLSDLLPVAWRATPGLWHGPARLEVAASGPAKAVAASVSLRLGDLELQARPVLNLDTGTLRGSLTLQDPNALRLISELGLPARLGLEGVPAWLGEGSLSLVSQLALGPGRQFSLNHAELVAGGLRTRMNLALDASRDQPVLTGSLNAEALPLPLPLPHAAPLPVALLQGWQARLQLKASRVLGLGETVLRNAAATVQVQSGRLSLDQISATLGGGTLSGSASWDAAAARPALAIDAKLQGAELHAPLFGLPIDLSEGRADLSVSLRTAGYSAAALTAGLEGTITAKLQDGIVTGFGLGSLREALRAAKGEPDAAALRGPLETGETNFRQLALQATVARGIVSLDKASLAGPAGTAEATGTLALPDLTEDLRIVLRPDMPNQPQVAVLVNGQLSSPQRTPELAGLGGVSAASGGGGKNAAGKPPDAAVTVKPAPATDPPPRRQRGVAVPGAR